MLEFLMKNGCPLLFVSTLISGHLLRSLMNRRLLWSLMNLQLLRSNELLATAISYLPRLCSFLADMDSKEGFSATPKSPTLPGDRTPNR